MVIQTFQAMGPSEHKMKRLVSPPSPTLTNPDMVLPHEPTQYPAVSSPSRRAWRERPPSPSYLRDKTSEEGRERNHYSGSAMVTPKRERLGLMSRKMMLLRSRTSSSGLGVNVPQHTLRNVSSEATLQDFDSAYGSSPTLMDVGNLAPEQPEERRPSVGGSSAESDDMAGLPQFLAKYAIGETASTDDDLDSDSPAPQRHDYSESIDSGLDAHRRQQEEEEQNSAILSKRAEEILANAKKRLNLMEGNLRGARDLVHPLTTANLKRATSVGSSYASNGSGYGGPRRLFTKNDYHYEPATQPQQPYRKLHAQASSPTMGQDFQGHWRGFSETEVPHRPSTALERTNTPIRLTGGMPATREDPSRTNPLRGSRSYDSLGSHAVQRPVFREPMYSRGSPDPNLAPLVEQEVHDYAESVSSRKFSGGEDGLGLYRPSSRSDDLREQMSSLKGRISSLRERAREDSLRRQSMQTLREPSPLNNATANAPEFFYTSSPGYGTPVLDTNAGVGSTSQNNSPVTPQFPFPKQVWEPNQVRTGNRNAFAEQAQRKHMRGQDSNGSSQNSRQKLRAADETGQQVPQQSLHKRTPSGTAIVQSSKHRYSHHESGHSRDGSGNLSHVQQNGDVSRQAQNASPSEDWHDGASEADASVYEDASSEQTAAVVAHEDREDAFDYENFFLHSAMSGSYGDGIRRESTSSEDSVSSVSTARGPTTAGAEEDDDDEFDAQSDNYPPPTPETPERLKQIERNLHKRTFSDESVSTIATFATANEGRNTPTTGSELTTAREWPMPPSENNTRPSTAIPLKRPTQIATSDSSSERADSGIGLSNRPNSSQSSKRSPLRSLKPKSSFPGYSTATTVTLSPPMSPKVLTNPATTAVNAILNPNGKQLGLKDKALLFSLIESLRTTCQKLQEKGEADYDSRILRRQLDDARRVLDGAPVPRPAGS